MDDNDELQFLLDVLSGVEAEAASLELLSLIADDGGESTVASATA
ncbi:hypothetical protein Gpo141_00013555, partial [Globisporangium polare]